MTEEIEYRIEYTVQRKMPDDDDFVDIGFGSSGECDSPSSATFALGSYVDNWQWETEGAMPDPEDVRAQHEAMES